MVHINRLATQAFARESHTIGELYATPSRRRLVSESVSGGWVTLDVEAMHFLRLKQDHDYRGCFVVLRLTCAAGERTRISGANVTVRVDPLNPQTSRPPSMTWVYAPDRALGSGEVITGSRGGSSVQFAISEGQAGRARGLNRVYFLAFLIRCPGSGFQMSFVLRTASPSSRHYAEMTGNVKAEQVASFGTIPQVFTAIYHHYLH